MQLNSPKRITVNATSAVFQVVVIGVVYFFLYRFLITRLGAHLLGLWSLVVATTSVANLANLGFSSGLVKFVADQNAKNNRETMGRLIYTALLSITILYLLISVAVMAVAPFLLGKLIEPEYLEVALQLLPWSLASLLINAAGGVFTSALEGIQKNYLRNFIYSVTSVVFLLLSLMLVPRYGIVGVAVAQNLQALLVLVYTFYHTRKNIPTFSLSKWGWNRTAFYSMLNYGYKFQLITVVQLVVDPVAKALLGKFGGLPTLAYYEMAYRLASQVRSVIVNAYQVTIPVIAHFNHNQKSYLRTFYLRSFPFVFTSGIIATSALIFFSAILSRFWIGHYEPVFVNYSIIIALGMMGNILCVPAYFNYLGIGKLDLLVVVQVIDATLNVLLCLLLSYFSPAYGVVFAWSIAAVLGAGMILYSFHRQNNLALNELVKKNNLMLLLIGTAVLVVSAVLYNYPSFVQFFETQNKWTELLVMGLFFLALFPINLYRNQHFTYYKNKLLNYLR
jgi:O-antigen/teichoic acid export membrane protein